MISRELIQIIKKTFQLDCFIGHNVQILTINHTTSPRERLEKKLYQSY